ncbi:MAG: NADH-quinone oxidoreductase subunit K [Pseudomonadota bacterium]|jgi:multicomponent Na+:H+ antiporter subunit C
MIGPSLSYALAGVALFALGLYGLSVHPHLLRKVLAFNVTGSGVFLVLVSLSQRDPGTPPDPVPQALVLTGIVVAVSATAFALALLRRLYALTGKTGLDDEPAP